MSDPLGSQGGSASKTRVFLALIAAALAFTDVILAYVRRHEIEYSSLGGGLFALALGLTMGRRR